ncbi:MCE family protein [Rhodococcoides kyotonense]|uniref:Phospholipid/cholesterol/gamma-HCH transport system substrate-binding protein n=1 Tax=Rhodococcoides kyotonense TaxID=398843 RepID=A0A239F8N9_9NOCA|nr:MlaD family protein [Rhodococcus kyotonensis]SNS53256.1 phospholipid/cholesterol/gamma-HCH transport system substrate-binding protein [Rhodococcus kyotonensis]
MRIMVALIAVASIAGGWFVFSTNDSLTVTADFAYIDGIYPGSPVRVLGVPVGTVDAVDPQGSSVRVTMSVTSDIDIPADAEAFVMNPSVVSDRFVELGPAYRDGPVLGDNVIPVERSHSPINWDQLMGSVTTLAGALGPDGGDIGSALDIVADGTAGLGPAMNDAIRNISQATAVVGGNSEQIGALIQNLNTLVGAIAAREGAVTGVTDSLDALGREIATQDIDVGTPIAQLRTMFDQLDRLLTDRGGDLVAVLANARDLTGRFAEHEAQFAEFVDLLPLTMQNIGNTIGDDQRARIRLNISTDLDQFATAVPLCRDLALPICTGAGLTNPVPVPIGTSDPLGLAQLMMGGR